MTVVVKHVSNLNSTLLPVTNFAIVEIIRIVLGLPLSASMAQSENSLISRLLAQPPWIAKKSEC